MKLSKTCVLAACLWAGAFLSHSSAQVDVTVNPIGLLFGALSAGADFAVADNFSLEGSLGIGSGTNKAANFKYYNLPITATGKYYFNPKNGADKFYADVFLRYVTRGYTVDDPDAGTIYSEYTQTRVGFGFGIGLKVASVKGLVFDINFGVGRALIDNTKYKDNSDEYEVDWTNVMIVGKLGLGYRFGGK